MIFAWSLQLRQITMSPSMSVRHFKIQNQQWTYPELQILSNFHFYFSRVIINSSKLFKDQMILFHFFLQTGNLLCTIYFPSFSNSITDCFYFCQSTKNILTVKYKLNRQEHNKRTWFSSATSYRAANSCKHYSALSWRKCESKIVWEMVLSPKHLCQVSEFLYLFSANPCCCCSVSVLQRGLQLVF